MAKPSNLGLHRANRAKSDEFYTQLSDIEKELRHYKEQFRGKVVYCNCDDPYESNFFKFFAANFEAWGLKKLITTSYAGSPIASAAPFKLEIETVVGLASKGVVNYDDLTWLIEHDEGALTCLSGDGDFRSEECAMLLAEADIVCTNPPFSLFREYVAQLMEYGKEFVIIGNMNAITYKEIFRLIKENKVWLGESIHSGDREFRIPDYYPLSAAGQRVDENGVKYIRVKGVRWYTNLDVPIRHEKITLYKRYTPVEYPSYSNYDAINVNKTADIPLDYDDVIGVPITFLDKYNPEQFEIIGQTHSGDKSPEVDKLRRDPVHRHRGILPGTDKELYARILVRRRK